MNKQGLPLLSKMSKHYEENTFIRASNKELFAYVDKHSNLSSHMNKSSWMMIGSSMNTKVDKDRGQKVGSHITMSGKIFGINLFLDEVITKYNPPKQKEWQTTGEINLLVIDHYSMGFEIKPVDTGSSIKIFIDYDLPKSLKTRWLGILLGDWYAKWCVKQMLTVVKNNFKK